MASGKGGTGKSTLTAAIGRNLSRAGKRVLLADMDAGVRSLEIILSAESKAPFNWLDVACGQADIAGAISDAGENLRLLHAPAEGNISVEPSAVRELLLNIAKDYDFILCDASAGVGSALDIASAASDSAILVTFADRIATAAARSASDFLYNKGIEDIGLIVNKLNIRKLPRSKDEFLSLDAIMDNVCARLTGVVPYDSDIASVAVGKRGCERCLSYGAVWRIAQRLMGQAVPLPEKEFK